jgi:hypothetical protein
MHDGPANHADVVIAAIAQAQGLTQTPDGKPIPAAAKLGIDLGVSLIDQEIDDAIRALSEGF